VSCDHVSRLNSVLDRVQNHLRVLDARQIEILGEVIGHCLTPTWFSAPTSGTWSISNRRTAPAILVISSSVVLQLLRRALRQPVLPLKPELPATSTAGKAWPGSGRFLPGDQQPDISFRNPFLDGLIRTRQTLLHLADLERRKVQRDRVLLDRLQAM